MPNAPSPERKRWRWLRHEAIDLGDVAVQIISVVVGILLALAINDWVQQRQQQKTVDQAMRSIRAELTANRVALRQNARRMFAMANAMRAAPANRNQPPRLCYAWQHWAGIGGINLTDAACQTAIATQALANMPYRQAQAVAQVYGWQHYRQQGISMDATGVLEHTGTLDFCAELADNVGRGDLALDRRYDALIGPDKAEPAAAPGQANATQ
ncbi:MAG TPA: hypothetical protein VF292_05985 [Rhodanobacteraceae bacterium]